MGGHADVGSAALLTLLLPEQLHLRGHHLSLRSWEHAALQTRCARVGKGLWVMSASMGSIRNILSSCPSNVTGKTLRGVSVAAAFSVSRAG